MDKEKPPLFKLLERPLSERDAKTINDAIQQARQETARQLIEEIERERFAEPQHIPQSGKEPVLICLTEFDLEELKSKYGGSQ